MRVCLGLFLLLSACGGPSPHFRGVAPSAVQVEGALFDVRIRGNLAEAVRRNPQYAPRLGPLRAQAQAAMEQASGCKVGGVMGDQAVMVGILDCKAAG